ncbi:MAG: hypothetical protein QXX41_14975 [Nitrososphaerota archaeon]
MVKITFSLQADLAERFKELCDVLRLERSIALNMALPKIIEFYESIVEKMKEKSESVPSPYLDLNLLYEMELEKLKAKIDRFKEDLLELDPKNIKDEHLRKWREEIIPRNYEEIMKAYKNIPSFFIPKEIHECVNEVIRLASRKMKEFKEEFHRRNEIRMNSRIMLQKRGLSVDQYIDRLEEIEELVEDRGGRSYKRKSDIEAP